MHNFWALPAAMAESVLRTLFMKDEDKATSPLSEALCMSAAHGEECGYSVHAGVALISVNLPITRSDLVSWSGKRLSMGQDSIRNSLMAAYADNMVKSILLVFNCPGGVVHGTKELADFIASSPKPIAAYVDGLCASAAFWLAAATGKIFCPQTGTVGSVGVLQMHTDFSKYYEGFGVKFTPITAGTYKAVGTDKKPLSKDDVAYLQNHLSAIHEVFKMDVKNGLGLSAPEEEWGEAQIFIGNEAVQLGLVTSIVQDVHEAIQILSKEIVMDFETLAAQHPQLLAEIRQKSAEDAAAKAKAEQEQEVTALLAVVKACAGDEAMQAISETLERCKAAKLSNEQIVALAPTLAVKVAVKNSAIPAEAKTEASPELSAMQNILSGLQAATPDPLTADPKQVTKTQGKSSLVSDAENRAQKETI